MKVILLRNFSILKKFIFFVLCSFPIITYGQWIQSNGPFKDHINALHVKGSTIFAGLHNIFIYSTDNGANWHYPFNYWDWYWIDNVSSIVSIGNNVLAGTSAGVFLSTDDGLTWYQKNAGLWDTSVTCLSNFGDQLIAGTHGNGGVFLSTDTGDTWNYIGLSAVTSLATLGSNIYAGTLNGVFFSPDTGTTWTPINNGLTNHLISKIICNDSMIFVGTDGGGMYRSQDSGSTWLPINNGLPSNLKVSALTENNLYLIAGGDSDGVFISNDNGDIWQSINNGLTNIEIGSIVFNGADLFCGTEGGIFISNDTGINWKARNVGIANCQVNDFTSIGQKIVSATEATGIYLSEDRGSSWGSINDSIPTQKIRALANNIGTLFSGTIQGIYMSSDSGSSWNYSGLNNEIINCINIFGSVILVGTLHNGAYISRNNGGNWSTINSGLTSTGVYAFAHSGLNLFCGTSNGVFLSTDTGSHWNAVNNGLPLSGVTTLEFIGTKLFAGSWGNGVYFTINNGSSWTSASVGLPPNVRIWQLVSTNSVLFAGTNSDGIYVSYNEGLLWNSFNSGLNDYYIFSLYIWDTLLFAGTESGVWLHSIANIVTTTQSTISNDKPFSMTVSATTDLNKIIKINLMKSTNVNLKILNGIGQEIETVNNSYLNSGTYEFTCDFKNIVAGFYLIVLNTDVGVQTKRILIN